MANRRMFSKTIVNSARFLKMPASARLLYYDLGMAADDEGIAEAYVVLCMTGANEADLHLLAQKNLVQILNDDLVIYITDWNENNQIKKDRFHSSLYHELLEEVQNGSKMDPSWNQNGSKLEPEVSIGKVNNIYVQNELTETRFATFWNAYPKRKNKKKAHDLWCKIDMDDALFDTIMTKLEAVKKTTDWTKDKGQYIPLPSTWLNGRRWEDEIENEEKEKPKQKPFKIGDDGLAHYV